MFESTTMLRKHAPTSYVKFPASAKGNVRRMFSDVLWLGTLWLGRPERHQVPPTQRTYLWSHRDPIRAAAFDGIPGGSDYQCLPDTEVLTLSCY